MCCTPVFYVVCVMKLAACHRQRCTKFVVKSWAGGRYKGGEDIYQTTNKLVCMYEESTIGP